MDASRDTYPNPAERDFLRLFGRHEPILRAYTRSILPTWDAVDDALQEASVVMWEKLGQLENDDGFLPWAKVIVRYKCLVAAADLRKERPVLSEEVLALVADGDEGPVADELADVRESLTECLGRIPEEQRELLLAPYAGDGHVRRLAERAGKSANAFYKLLGDSAAGSRTAYVHACERQERDMREHDLMHRYLLGSLDESDVAELDRLLAGSPELRREYRLAAGIDAALRETVIERTLRSARLGSRSIPHQPGSRMMFEDDTEEGLVGSTTPPPPDDDSDESPMEDSQKRKLAADCWKRANDSVSKEDFEYAINMYRKAVEFCPDNLTFRQSLRAAEHKLYKNNGKGKTGMFVKGTYGKVRMRTKTARMRSQWDELDKAAEDGLALNPWDAQFNSDVGEACYQRGYLEVASMAFEAAHKGEPTNTEHLRSLATVEEDRGNNVKASNLWNKVYQLDSTDTEARRKSTENLTKDTLKGGYEDAEGTRDVETKRDAYRGEDRSAFGRGDDKDELSTEEQLQRQIRKNPEQVESYLKYAEFLKGEKRWEEAREQYGKGLSVSGGGDHNIRELAEDCEIEILKHNLDLARARATEQPDAKGKAARDKAERELVLREMEVLRGRIERYPNDARHKFELAKRYMRFQKFQEAIPLLQQCVNDSRLKSSVLVMLGKCFIGVKNEGIAARQFAKAVELINPVDDPNDFCDCHYFLGRLAENKEDRDAAENHYNEILSVDYGYKDVQKRLDDLAG